MICSPELRVWQSAKTHFISRPLAQGHKVTITKMAEGYFYLHFGWKKILLKEKQRSELKLLFYYRRGEPVVLVYEELISSMQVILDNWACLPRRCIS